MATHLAEPTNQREAHDSFISWLHKMREHDPVHRDPETDEWHVFGHPEALEALANHGALSNNLAAPLPENSPFQLFRIGNLSLMDPPRQTQLRALVRRAFTPRHITSLTSMVTAVVGEHLTRLRQQSTIEFIEDFASPFVSTVIARKVGIPDSDHDLFRRWTTDLLVLTDPSAQRNELRTVARNTREIGAYLTAHISNRRRDPQGDITSSLVLADVAGETLGDAEIAGLLALLLTTGHRATQTPTNAIICLDQHRDAATRLRADPSLLSGAIDEVMRFRSQTTRLARLTTEPATIGRYEIAPGQPISIWLSAANRDPRVFSHPDVFDIARSPNPHIAVGHGIHYCIGAPLARLETEIALRAFLSATADFSVDYATSSLLDPRLISGASALSVAVAWRG